MAFLIKKQRKNPENGETAIYWMIGRWVSVEGRRVQRTAGLGFVTEKQATAALARYEAELEGGGDPLRLGGGSSPEQIQRGPDRRDVAPLPTMREWWGDTRKPWPEWPDCRMRTYLLASGMTPKTLRVWDSSRRALLPLIGDLRLDRITAAEGDRLVAHWRSEGLSARTMQMRIDALRRAMRVAVEDGLLPSAPHLRRPRKADREGRFLTRQQTGVLLSALTARRPAGRRTGARSHLAVLLAVSLGLRPGEVLTRRWSHLDLGAGTLRVCPVELPDGTRWTPKAGSARLLPMPRALTELLREERGAETTDGWLFPSRDRAGWPQSSFKRALAGACKAAGLPVLNPHGLRHTATTRWVEGAVDIPTMMRLGGWKTPTVPLQVYAHTTEARARAAIEGTALAFGQDRAEAGGGGPDKDGGTG